MGPLYKGHFGTSHFVLYKRGCPLEIKKVRQQLNESVVYCDDILYLESQIPWLFLLLYFHCSSWSGGCITVVFQVFICMYSRPEPHLSEPFIITKLTKLMIFIAVVVCIK